MTCAEEYLEWVRLMEEAKAIGLTPEDVRKELERIARRNNEVE